jgi:hypothetical protein
MINPYFIFLVMYVEKCTYNEALEMVEQLKQTDDGKNT